MSKRNDDRLFPVQFPFGQPRNKNRTNLELADMIERGYSRPGIVGETNQAYITALNTHAETWEVGKWLCCPVGAGFVEHFKGALPTYNWLHTLNREPITDGARLLRVSPVLLQTISRLNMTGKDRATILQWLVRLPDGDEGAIWRTLHQTGRNAYESQLVAQHTLDVLAVDIRRTMRARLLSLTAMTV